MIAGGKKKKKETEKKKKQEHSEAASYLSLTCGKALFISSQHCSMSLFCVCVTMMLSCFVMFI